MITVTNMSREFNEVEVYLMTIAPGIKSVKDAEDGEKILLSHQIKKCTLASHRLLSGL